MVPRSFGLGTVIPLLKDRLADASKVENYRAITLCSVISKIFEYCVLDKFDTFLCTSDLQFGFKKGIGCAQAINLMQDVTSFFNKRGSTVFLTALDASKAFDRLSHCTMFEKLVGRNTPTCLTRCLLDWYSKLISHVRWNNCLSDQFHVLAGVRQGGVLSPTLFNIYVNDLIFDLQNCGAGCHLGSSFVGCIMYADDILLLSPSISGLQIMLDVCSRFALRNDILFNRDKSVCMAVGPLAKLTITEMNLGGFNIKWVSDLRYLGVQFIKGTHLQVDCNFLKRKFYAACNGILYNCKLAAESLKVFLVETFCLPLLLYCIGALTLSSNELQSLNVCWNDAIRKIYGLHRWESVKQIMFYCNLMPVEYHYFLRQWKFHSANAEVDPGSCLYKRLAGNVSSATCCALLHKFSPDGRLRTISSTFINNYFKDSVTF
jgi:hypothetical protein